MTQPNIQPIIEARDVEAVDQAIFEKKDELFSILETAEDKKFIAEVLADIQSLARVEKALTITGDKS